ncbi:MAG: Ldh family oxidoreductase [Azospirillaceae bacterium]|nr:Ldh family oxidoreductase [Azospirillaceae bacterium]
MSDQNKTIPAADLKTFVAGLFKAKGLDAEWSAIIADALVWAELRGVESHGLGRVPRYLELLDSGEANARADLRIEQPRAATAIVHADGAPGPVAMTLGMRRAIDIAKEAGVGWVSVRGTVHTGAVGHYADQAAQAGLIGIAIVAGMPNMGYTGVKGAAVATSPLAIAVPSSDHGTVLLDMATATIALGRIAQHLQKGIPLPEGAATTKEGEPTTDPAVAAIPTPMAGAKGSGMSLMFEFLTSVLTDNAIVAPFHEKAPGGRKHRQNASLIAVDIAAFREPAGYRAAIDAAILAIKGLPRADEGTEILVPGERGGRTLKARSASGLTVRPKLWAQLEKAAADNGVALP